MVSDKCSETEDERIMSRSYITFLSVSRKEKGRQGILLIIEQNHLESKNFWDENRGKYLVKRGFLIFWEGNYPTTKQKNR